MHALALALLLAQAPPAPPTPIVVRSEGAVTTGHVQGSAKARYALVPPAKGTLIVVLQPIHGPTPRMILRTADGRGIRRDKNGQVWARRDAGEPLVLEVTARQPSDKQTSSVYQLRVLFDVDRPREERGKPRPARPGDIVTVPRHSTAIDRVVVDGIQTDFQVRGTSVLVTIPAFAQSGTVELHHEQETAEDTAERLTVELIGTEPAFTDVVGEPCEVPGCIVVTVGPSVGPAWLQEIARVVDANVVSHAKKTGAVVLRLRLPSSESFAVSTLSAMPGVRSARALASTR